MGAELNLGGEVRAVEFSHGVIAGWTGRDRTAVDHHIAELAAIGVPPPSVVPLFYRVSSALFTTADRIETVGSDSSGEAEPVLFGDGARLWLGVGSDHTDRKLESHSVALSKQICAKPIAPRFWPFGEVVDHLDALILRSWVRNDPVETWIPYQDGTLAAIRPLSELVDASPVVVGSDAMQGGSVMMCGTLGVLSGGVRPVRFFRVQLHDPVLSRTIEHAYEVSVLPIVS